MSPPSLVRKIDWINNHWPDLLPDDRSAPVIISTILATGETRAVGHWVWISMLRTRLGVDYKSSITISVSITISFLQLQLQLHIFWPITIILKNLIVIDSIIIYFSIQQTTSLV